jgi:phage-related minor tail protein
MAQFDALLRIKADVTGENEITGLTRSLRGAQGAVAAVKASFAGLGALVPAALGAGVVGLAKGAIDAADNMRDLSQRTGISVEMLSKLDVAAKQSGTNIEAVGTALGRFNGRLVEAAKTGSGPTSDALKQLGLSATDASGKIKSADKILLEIADRFAAMPDGPKKSALALDLFGRAGQNLIPLLNGGSAAIKNIAATMTTDFANSADRVNDKLVVIQARFTALTVSLAEKLLPAFESLVNAVDSIANAFSALPGPIQQFIVGIGGIAIAIGIVAGPIINLIKLIGIVGTAFASLQIGALIAGWLGALGPAMAAIGSFLATAAAAIAAFFTGPIGIGILIAAGIALLVKAIYDFREPIMKFLAWLYDSWVQTSTAVGKVAYNLYVQPWVNAFKLMETIATKAWESIANNAKGAFRGILQFMANGLNIISGEINRLVDSYNTLPGPDLPRVPPVRVPAFGDGGYVTKPTMALVGEKGPEYIIPARKLQAATGGGMAAPVINITTGPVIEQNGQQYVSMTDLERAMRATADGVMSRLRTPSARLALGMG